MTIWQYAAVAIFVWGLLTGMGIMAIYYYLPPKPIRKQRRRERWEAMKNRPRRDHVG